MRFVPGPSSIVHWKLNTDGLPNRKDVPDISVMLSFLYTSADTWCGAAARVPGAARVPAVAGPAGRHARRMGAIPVGNHFFGGWPRLLMHAFVRPSVV